MKIASGAFAREICMIRWEGRDKSGLSGGNCHPHGFAWGKAYRERYDVPSL